MKSVATYLAAFVLIAGLIWLVIKVDRLHEENSILRRQAAEAAAVAVENARLSNAVALIPSQSLASEQFKELLRLRAEANAIRQQKIELEKLRSENQQQPALSTASFLSQPPSKSEFMADEALTNAGYASAEAALQTFSWAWSRGDRKTILESISPQGRVRLEKEWATKSDAELAALFRNESTSNYIGYRIVNRKNVSEDESVFSVYFGGAEESLHKMKLKRFDGQWKYAGDDD